MTITMKIIYTIIRWLYVMPIIRLIETMVAIIFIYILKKGSLLIPFKIILNIIAYFYIFYNFHCIQKLMNFIYI